MAVMRERLSCRELPMSTASSRVLARLIFPSFKRAGSNWLSIGACAATALGLGHSQLFLLVRADEIIE